MGIPMVDPNRPYIEHRTIHSLLGSEGVHMTENENLLRLAMDSEIERKAKAKRIESDNALEEVYAVLMGQMAKKTVTKQ
jgi:hypothetical protein